MIKKWVTILQMGGCSSWMTGPCQQQGSALLCTRTIFFLLKLGSDSPANDEVANQSPTYFIEEFHWDATALVKVKTHWCEPFEHPPKATYKTELRACHGVLMVTSSLSSHYVNGRFGKQLAWLYDLSTMKWTILGLPHLSVGRPTYDDPYNTKDLSRRCLHDVTYDVQLMLEPQWGIWSARRRHRGWVLDLPMHHLVICLVGFFRIIWILLCKVI